MLADILVILLLCWIFGRLFGQPTSPWRTVGGPYGYDIIGFLIFVVLLLAIFKVLGAGLVY
jgi:hypothetical protein